jgi:peroxiredoxin
VRLSAVLAIVIVASGCASSPAADAPAPPAAATPAAAPADDHGASLIDTPAPGWDVGTWFNSPPLTLAGLRGRVVLVRWFMDPSCPMCSATAPALRAFDEAYRDQGLTVIGMYHHKDPKPLVDDDVRGYAATYGYRFPIAIDPDWRTLKRWWLDRERDFTSVSFLIDRRGVIRAIHRGGRMAPGEPETARIEATIRALLAEPG